MSYLYSVFISITEWAVRIGLQYIGPTHPLTSRKRRLKLGGTSDETRKTKVPLIDYVQFYVPLKTFSLKGCKIYPYARAEGLWARWNLYRATPTGTRASVFPVSSEGPPPLVAFYDTQGMRRIYSNVRMGRKTANKQTNKPYQSWSTLCKVGPTHLIDWLFTV
jgi:hypothetical protein